jgi:multiple sugar transport system substrate-binding protein
VEITYTAVTGGIEDIEAWGEVIEAFEEANPDITVTERHIPNGEFAAITLQVQSDTASDLTAISDDDTWGLGAAFIDLDDMIGTQLTEEEIRPLAWQAFQPAGQTKFVTGQLGPQVGIYNVDLFEQAGVEPPPTSWEDAWEFDEFIEAARALTQDTDGDGDLDQYGFAHSFSLAYIFAYTNGGEPTGPYNENQTECRMDEPDVVEAYQLMSDYRHQDPVIAPTVESSEAFALFAEGRVAMTTNSGDALTAYPDTENMALFPLPKLREDAVTVAFGSPMGIPRTSEHPEEAKRLLAYLMGEEAQVMLVDRGLIGVPMNRAAAEYAAQQLEDAGLGNPQLFAEAFDVSVDLMNINPLGEEFVNRFIRTGAREVLSGQISAEEMLSRECEGMNQFIEDVGWEAP